MSSIEAAKKELMGLINKSKFEKMVSVSSILTRLLKDFNLKPIIVGGLAVEIYTRGEYTTSDIDFIFSQREIIKNLLLQLGFIEQGRHFFHEDLLISIEIPNDMLEDADYDKVIEIELENGDSIYVIGIEDIILDRLRGCVHWKSPSDCEWGRRLLMLYKEQLDIDYMVECSRRDLTYDVLCEWLDSLN